MAPRASTIIVKPELFGKAFIPETVRLKLERDVRTAGFKKDPYQLFGIYFYTLILLTIIFYFTSILPKLHIKTLALPPVKAAIAIFILTILYVTSFLFLNILIAWAAFRSYLNLRIFQRMKEIELNLENYLRYVSENLRGGLNFEQALMESIRPEFGTLSDEMRLVMKKVLTGSSLDEALREFTEKYESPLIRRVFDIITESLHGGGKISDIIEDIVENLSILKDLKNELVTTNLSYSIFISAVVLVITPILFSLSTQFIIVLNKIAAKIGPAVKNAGTGGLSAFTFSSAAVSIESFQKFALIVLAVNAFGAALLTNIINNGDWRHGGLYKYVLYPLISMILYAVSVSLISGVFQSLVNI